MSVKLWGQRLTSIQHKRKHAFVLVGALLVNGCSQSTVMELGPNRFRATSDNTMSASSAEASAVGSAQAHCAARGLMADTRITETRPYSLYSYGGASVEFQCVPRP